MDALGKLKTGTTSTGSSDPQAKASKTQDVLTDQNTRCSFLGLLAYFRFGA